MFNTSSVLTQKGPLANLWTVISNPKKLSKEQIINTNIRETIDSIPSGNESIDTISSFIYALAYIYSKKVIYTENDMRTMQRRISINNSDETVDTSHNVDLLVSDMNDMTLPDDFDVNKFEHYSTTENWLDMTTVEQSTMGRIIYSPSDKFRTPEANRGSARISSLETQRTFQSAGEEMNDPTLLENDYTEPMIDENELQQDMPMEEVEGRESRGRRSTYTDVVEKLKESIMDNNQLELDGNISPLDEDYDGLTASAKHRRSMSLLNKRKRRKTQFDAETELSDEIIRKMKNEDMYSDDEEENDEESDEDGNTSRRRRNNNNNNNLDKIIRKRKYKKPEYSKFINPITAMIRNLPKMKKLPRDEDRDDIDEIDLMQLGIDNEPDGVDDDFELPSMNNNNNNNENDTMLATPIINTSVEQTISYLDGPTFNDTLDDLFEMGNNGDTVINEENEENETMIVRNIPIVSELKSEFEENDVIEFQTMEENKLKKNVAVDFLNLLSLAANNYIIASQANTYDTIEVERGGKWSEIENE